MDNKDYYYNYMKYKNKYFNLKNSSNLIGGNNNKILRIYFSRRPEQSIVPSNSIKKVTLKNELISLDLYKNFHFGIIFDVIAENQDGTMILQGIKKSKNHSNEPRLINYENVPAEHLNIVEDGEPLIRLYPRIKPSDDKKKCIITYFPEEDRSKIEKIINSKFPISVNSLEHNLQTLVFDVLSIDGDFCEIEYENFYFGRYPTKYLLFGEQFKKN
tara:strand:- start:27 stop:671 length:645 start_codon:yes stop_codon:yes gene_type:complete